MNCGLTFSLKVYDGFYLVYQTQSTIDHDESVWIRTRALALPCMTSVMQEESIPRYCNILTSVMWYRPVWLVRIKINSQNDNNLTQPSSLFSIRSQFIRWLTFRPYLMRWSYAAWIMLPSSWVKPRHNVYDNIFDNSLHLAWTSLSKSWMITFKCTLTCPRLRVRSAFLRPGIRKNINAFVQWTRDKLRLGRDPNLTPFPVGQVGDLIRR